MNNADKKKPSDFTNYPFGSVFNKSEYETIALNIMKILARTGNEFRGMGWVEYKKERLKDGNFSEGEKSFFIQSMPYCRSLTKAKTFSKSWN
jgi:hypothetical protein